MASMTNAEMRALGQLNVRNTSTTAPGLTTAQWTMLLNEAMFEYAAIYPEECYTSENAATTLNSNSVSLTTSKLKTIDTGVEAGFPPLFDPLEKVTIQEINKFLIDDSSARSPQKFAAWRNNDDDTWSIRIWPKADGAYNIQWFGMREPTALSADADLTPFQESSCRAIVAMASVKAARLLGRSDAYVQQLASLVPDKVKEHQAVVERKHGPRYYEGKDVD